MENSIFGMEIFEAQTFSEFISRFIFNLITIYVIARLIYFKLRPNRNYLFTLFIFNIIIFLLTYLLNSVKLSLGFAFGIFAIFSILRYRTQMIPIKEMTYMFISISLAIVNALSTTSITLVELVFANVAVIFFTFVLEKTWVKNELKKTVLYEKINLIHPDKRQELIEDLKQRTGIDIHRVEIGRIDFLRDTARIRIYYYDSEESDEDNYA